MLEGFKSVALVNNVSLLESEQGWIIQMPEVNHHDPLLLSVDDGYSWTPEARVWKDGKSLSAWGGRISLRGSELAAEITCMFTELKLGSPDHAIKVAKELQAVFDNKLFN